MAVVVAGHRAAWKPLCVGKMGELHDFDKMQEAGGSFEGQYPWSRWGCRTHKSWKEGVKGGLTVMRVWGKVRDWAWRVIELVGHGRK